MDPSRKPTERAEIEAQRRLLQSLGFGFVVEPAPIPESAAQKQPAAPPPTAPPRSRPPAPRNPGPATPIAAQPAVPEAERNAALEAIAARVASCTACPLHHTRNHPVAGEGATAAPRIIFIGEAPTADDDATGRPFQGEIGRMLSDIVKAMKLSPAEVYFTMAAKCHPIGGRTPRPEELAACAVYLHRQIELLRPRAIVSFGIGGVQTLLPESARGGIQQVRGHWLDYRGIPLLPTFALTYIHRNTPRKRVVWEDLQTVMKKIGD